jgi:hypothetical protein
VYGHPRQRRRVRAARGGHRRHWSRRLLLRPAQPWQRGSIENANGRLRRDFPRKTALEDYSDADIDDVTWNLNATPRKCLGYLLRNVTNKRAMEMLLMGDMISAGRAAEIGLVKQVAAPKACSWPRWRWRASDAFSMDRVGSWLAATLER